VSDLSQIVRTACARKGWDLSELAEKAGISRTTLYHLLEGHTDKPRLATLSRLAEPLGLEVDELLGGPPSPLATPITPTETIPFSEAAVREFDAAANPSVDEVARERPDLFRGWEPEDWAELRSMFGTGGALNPGGVVRAADAINRRREAVRKLRVVLETHLSDVAIGLVETLYEMVRVKGA
jgi:transcriptional regulator with XRE-family HTH domain